VKRTTLLELADYVSSAGGQKLFSEALLGDMVHMVSVNIFRTLPPPSANALLMEEGSMGGEGGAADDPYVDPAWMHLELVYEFLLRLIVSSEVKAKTAKRYITANFCASVVDMFDSEDQRERWVPFAGGDSAAHVHAAVHRQPPRSVGAAVGCIAAPPPPGPGPVTCWPLQGLPQNGAAPHLRQVHVVPGVHSQGHLQCVLRVRVRDGAAQRHRRAAGNPGQVRLLVHVPPAAAACFRPGSHEGWRIVGHSCAPP
jgi:hypothetical protein